MPHSAAISGLDDSSRKAETIWKLLNRQVWPFTKEDLPKGTVVVGGAIRDALLKRFKKTTDIDLIVPCEALKVSYELSQKTGGTLVVLDQKREIARLVFKDWTVDIANQEGREIEDDLWRRDFRINAIALTFEKTPRLIDPTGGIQDLRTQKLIAVREQNFLDDSLRLLRAFRFMAEMAFTLEPETETWIKTHRKLLSNSAPERIQVEIHRIVNGPYAANVLPLLHKTKLLEPWQDSFTYEGNRKQKLKHNSQALSNSEKLNFIPLVFLTNLLSDSGLEKLKFSKKEQKKCKLLRFWQNQYDGESYESLNEKDRLQLHQDLEEDLPALIVQLLPADQVIWMNRWRDCNDPLFHPSCPLNGHTLKKCFNLSSSKEIGQLMHHLCHERAFGRLVNKEEAISTARYWLEQN